MSISIPAQRLGLYDIPGNSVVHQNGADRQRKTAVESSPQLTDTGKPYSSQRLNQLLADTHVLYAYFQKYHWLLREAATYQLHLLFGKFAAEQNCLIKVLSERIQNLGTCPVVDPRHIAELARIPRAPDGGEPTPAMLSRLLNATEVILIDAYLAAAQIGERTNSTTIDPGILELVRVDEVQAQFLCQHIAKHSARPHIAWPNHSIDP